MVTSGRDHSGNQERIEVTCDSQYASQIGAQGFEDIDMFASWLQGGFADVGPRSMLGPAKPEVFSPLGLSAGLRDPRDVDR